jgi:cell division ATPase FtsA
MKIKQLSTHKRLTNLEITEKEVNSLLESISQEADELNYEILKIMPIKWIIDDTHITKNPVGMDGRKLELVANVFMIPSPTYKDIEKIFNELEIDIIDIIPNIL